MDAILATWGKQPLGFEPGTRWEHGNTGYAIAGRIIEMASAMPLDSFIGSRITGKLGMRSAVDTSATQWDDSEPQGHELASHSMPA